ncbi:MAG: COR domain-containing protein [Cyanobacteria bacterium P01_H01_bin.162]
MNWRKLKAEQRTLLALIHEVSRENIVEFDLSDQGLTAIPSAIGRLTNLRSLNLSGNHLEELPDAIGDLVYLEELDVSNNELTDVPKELGELLQLENLNLSQNQLTAMPKELGQLSSLNRLDLSDNQLTVLPKELGQLTDLEELYIFRNQLTELPKELGQLQNLVMLSLYQNHLTQVPQELSQLANLSYLYLSDNQLTVLPKELTQLPNLSELYLHDNEGLELSDEILGPNWKQVINDKAEPANPKDILDYYLRIQAEETPLNEAKLILVGFGAVGKTSLVNRLVHETFDLDSKKTEGIQITRWPVTLNDEEDITLHVWDFGGQEIMHSTHQFFLTERSLYLLVLNGRQGHEDEDAEYWLELIESFGGNSPVIVVLNKITEHAFDVNRGALQQKFPNIRAFILTDCAGNIGLDELQSTIKRETDRLEFLRTPFPASWLTIKNKLAGMDKNYISYETYRDLCQQDGEADTSAQDSLANCLHSLGIALNYKDDPRLRDTHVLNPHWVTNGIYTLLNASELAVTKGELEATSLSRTLDPTAYPPERHGFLLELMRKFELCFRFEEDENRFLIPDLLDKQQPPDAAEFALTDCLNLRYEYPILPEGLLPRFIVRTHVLSEHQLRWRTGVILHFEGNRALVKGDRADRCVTISIDGPFASRRRLLAIIRYDFERIHSNFKFEPQELVPVPAYPQVMLSYQDLLVMEESGLQEMPQVINGKVEKLNVRDLLNGVDIEGSRKRESRIERQSDALRLFYSYSHKDDLLREQLETHLKLLQRQGLIQPWHDRRILPGDDWEDAIDDNLNRADIILFLVSPDFLNSDYCYEIEMPQAMERHEKGEATVIPIIVRPVDWRGTPFNKLSWLPQNGDPVTQWPDRDAAWLNVETGIKDAIAAMKARD